MYNEVIGTIYFLQNIIAVLIIVLLIVTGLTTGKYVRIVSTSILLVILVLHYYIISMVSGIENITIYPFVIVEGKNGYYTVTIDFGQVIVVSLAWFWRREIYEKISVVKNKIKVMIEILRGLIS
ncbi:hypothetical protein J4526_02950 [Desulfurococcaceae archaeon MEX13E-LK6-19]|nr:hypothetical protein J4526_02950 [Desulfurococcaceae archaeon MEX13E-LK6-19]